MAKEEIIGNAAVLKIENGFVVTTTSRMTGMEHSMFLPTTYEQLVEYLENKSDRFIQDIFPELNADEREFLMTGITPGEWNSLFGGEE